jgi:hypothetical protein
MNINGRFFLAFYEIIFGPFNFSDFQFDEQ